jgi:hypothetical protein
LSVCAGTINIPFARSPSNPSLVGFHHRGGATVRRHAVERELYARWGKTLARVQIALRDMIGCRTGAPAEPHHASLHTLSKNPLIGERRICLQGAIIDARIGERRDAMRQHELERPTQRLDELLVRVGGYGTTHEATGGFAKNSGELARGVAFDDPTGRIRHRRSDSGDLQRSGAHP